MLMARRAFDTFRTRMRSPGGRTPVRLTLPRPLKCAASPASRAPGMRTFFVLRIPPRWSRALLQTLEPMVSLRRLDCLRRPDRTHDEVFRVQSDPVQHRDLRFDRDDVSKHCIFNVAPRSAANFSHSV